METTTISVVSPSVSYTETPMSTATPTARHNRHSGELDASRTSRVLYGSPRSVPGEDCAPSPPSPLLRDRTQRAIDRFFLDWIMHPCCIERVCPGYLHLAAQLYNRETSSPVLRSAVEALAFANVRGALDGNSRAFAVKAQASYGRAIQELRGLLTTASPHVLTGDDIVAAIIFLDNWELMYADRGAIPGSHGGMLFHILKLRSDLNLGSNARHPIWRAANYRLLIHIIVSGEQEKVPQLRAAFDLQPREPYARMVMDAFRIIELREEIQQYMAIQPVQDEENLLSPEDPGAFTSLIARARQFVEEARSWMCDISGIWKPQATDLAGVYDTRESRSILQQRLDLASQYVLEFHGIWMAAIWASHWACLLLLHEGLADAIRVHISQLQSEGSDEASLHEEEASVKQLASNILQAVPFVLGHVSNNSCPEEPSCNSGMMLARLFFLFPLSVVEKSASASFTQQNTAANIRRWLQGEHKVG